MSSGEIFTLHTKFKIILFFYFQKYSSRDLRGLKVEHDINTFKEGQSVILTLKDRGKWNV